MVLVPLMPVFLYPCANRPSSVPNELVHTSRSDVLTSCRHSRHVPEVGSKTAFADSDLGVLCSTFLLLSELGSVIWSWCHLCRVLAGCSSIIGR